MISNGRSITLWERDRERELTAAIALMKKEHKAEVEQLKAQNKERNSQLSHMKHMVFGRSSEKKSCFPVV
ncbi:hypothetical protein J7439_12570 [Salinisphaera sp. G21_0]|nr:hypothetical protein [Salinisphaera sp. G21_0]